MALITAMNIWKHLKLVQEATPMPKYGHNTNFW